jgi:VWFA-related protein
MDQFTRIVRNYCAVCRCAAAGNTTDDPGCAAAKSRVQMFLTSSSEATYLLDRQFLRELSEVVNAIASMPTSRTVILISDGFNRFSGRELYDILINYGPADRSFAFTPRDTRPDFDAVLKIATKDNVKFYTIDSRGLYTAASTPGSGFDASSSVSVHTQMDSRTSANLTGGVPPSVLSPARENTDALAELARQTGGLFFENNNETLKGIQQAVADARESYVLAYVPDNKAVDGKYRSITVSVRGGKRKVVAKPGYWSAAK